MNFSENLKQLRKEKKLKQADIASYFGVGRTTVTSWENGTAMPNIDILDRLATLLGVSTDNLLGRVPQIEKYKRDEQNVQLLAQYSRLNDFGKREAVKRVGELCLIPKYTVRDMPIAAHNDAEINDEELALMRQDIDEL